MRKVLFFLAMMVAPFLAKAQGTAPEFSTEEAPVWYYIQFKAGSGVVSDKGEGNIMRTAEAVIDETDTEDTVIQNELSQKTLLCLHELEEPYKEVFMLSVLGGFSLKEISSTFGKSESWARVTFYRAKQKLSERMRQKYEL